MERTAMQRFWDRRAEEDAFFFVDNRLQYGRGDAEQFWAGGADDLAKLLDAVGAQLQPSDDVVEIGCGVGRLTRVIAHRVGSVRALDVSERMLELARRHNPKLRNVMWLQGDGASLAGLEDASADACVSYVVFQHIPDPRVTLGYVREMGRVLRPGGWAAFQISNDPSIHRRRPAGERVRSHARALLRRGPRGQASAPWLGSAVDLDDLRAAAAGAGMRIERVHGEGTQFCMVLLRRH